MSRYPCPTPTICGVAYHRDPYNCRGTRQYAAPSVIPTPSLAKPISDEDYQAERDAFLDAGGEIIEELYEEGRQKKSEIWYMDGKLHRENGPAWQKWHQDGTKEYERWFLNGDYHREDGPAQQMWWHGYDALVSETWCIHGERHREDGPAYRTWNEDGSLRYEEWRLNGVEHRLDGPAVQKWYPDGRKAKVTFSIRGIHCTEKELAVYRDAIDSGLPHEWAMEMALGSRK